MADMTLNEDSIPYWPSGVRFRHDETRDRWIIVAPERILVPRGPGADIARLIDGNRSIGDIADHLAREYDADVETITDESIDFLQQLADQGYLDT